MLSGCSIFLRFLSKIVLYIQLNKNGTLNVFSFWRWFATFFIVVLLIVALSGLTGARSSPDVILMALLGGAVDLVRGLASLIQSLLVGRA